MALFLLVEESIGIEITRGDILETHEETLPPVAILAMLPAG